MKDNEAALKNMSLLEHLNELRRCLVKSALALAVCFVVAFCFNGWLYSVLAAPLVKFLPKGTTLVFLRLQEPFAVSVKVALSGAIILGSPLIILFLWQFIAPALYKHEKRYCWPFLLSTFTLFAGGCAFAYRYAFPAACRFLLEVGQPYTPQISMDEYYEFAMMIILGMGLIFEIPIVVFFLSLFRILTPRFMLKTLRHAIIIIFLVAAIVSPTTDVVNLFLFAAPMILLYLGSILVCWLVYRRKEKKRNARG